MPSFAGSFVAYKVIQLLSKPFEDWDAYKLGIIDIDGNSLKKAKTSKEQAAWDMFQIMVRNLKQLLAKFPFGKTKVASFAAALWLIKENYSNDSDKFEQMIFEHIGITQINILLEASTTSYLPKGLYEFDNKTFNVKENTNPIAVYLDQNIYKIQNIATKEYEYVTLENIVKYK